MEAVTGISVVIISGLVLWLASLSDAATAKARRRSDGGSGGGADIIVDPSSCDSGAADGGSGCGGGCGGCGS